VKDDPLRLDLLTELRALRRGAGPFGQDRVANYNSRQAREEHAIVSESSNNTFNHDPHLNFVIPPEAPTSLGASGTPSPENNEKKTNKKLRNGLIAGAAGITLAAVGFAGIGLANSNNGEKPPQATETSAPADTNEFANEKGNNVTPEYEFTADLINIPAGLSDQEYATKVLDNLQKWDMAGANDKNYVAWVGADLSDSVQKDIAAENSQVVQNSHFFSEVGLGNSDIQLFMKNATLVNEGSVQSWLATYNKAGNPPALGQREAFNATISLSSVTVVSTSETGRELIIMGTQYNNSEMNTVSKHQNIVYQNGLAFELHITTSVLDGFEQINTIAAS